MNAGWELLQRTIEIAQITITLSQCHMLGKQLFGLPRYQE